MAIKLELEIAEVNVILRTLGKHPFDEIAGLIDKIKQQGEPQAEAEIKAQQEAQAAQAAPEAQAPAAN